MKDRNFSLTFYGRNKTLLNNDHVSVALALRILTCNLGGATMKILLLLSWAIFSD